LRKVYETVAVADDNVMADGTLHVPHVDPSESTTRKLRVKSPVPPAALVEENVVTEPAEEGDGFTVTVAVGTGLTVMVVLDRMAARLM
jgi:hypothetical protein